MSHIASTWAWSQPLANAKHKLLLVKLADSANDDGVCWPSVRTLSLHTGISKSAVSRMVNMLAEQGVLTIKETIREDGSKGANVYTLNMEGVPLGGVPPRVGQGVPAKDGTGCPTHGRDRTVSESSGNRQNLAAIRPPPPDFIEGRRYRVHSSRAGHGPFTVDLGASKPVKGDLPKTETMGGETGLSCSCENKHPTVCRHVKAAAKAEWKRKTAADKLLRDAIWEGLVDSFGPARAEGARKLYGNVKEAVFAQLDGDETVARTVEAYKAEVVLRHTALANEWGLGRVTISAFRTNWELAGRLARGDLPAEKQGSVFDEYDR